MDLAFNKQATFNYEVLDTWEAGLVLSGPEVKSIKHKRVDLKGSYVRVTKNELWLIGAHIAPYQPAKTAQQNYEPKHARKLLVTKKEINQIRGKLTQKALTIVPLKVYTTRGLVKLEIAMVRGKKLVDKKEKIKRRDLDRDTKRALKNF